MRPCNAMKRSELLTRYKGSIKNTESFKGKVANLCFNEFSEYLHVAQIRVRNVGMPEDGIASIDDTIGKTPTVVSTSRGIEPPTGETFEMKVLAPGWSIASVWRPVSRRIWKARDDGV